MFCKKMVIKFLSLKKTFIDTIKQCYKVNKDETQQRSFKTFKPGSLKFH